MTTSDSKASGRMSATGDARWTEGLRPVTLARITGVLYLVIIVLGLFSELVVRGGAIVPGDPAATAGRMGLAGLGYLVASFTLFLAPDYVDAVAPVYALPLLGEVSLCGWLILRGVRTTD